MLKCIPGKYPVETVQSPVHTKARGQPYLQESRAAAPGQHLCHRREVKAQEAVAERPAVQEVGQQISAPDI